MGLDMVEAYVFLCTKTGELKNALNEIETLDEVKRVRMITGDYDVIVLAEADDISTLTQTVVEEVHKIPGVTDTTTAIVVG